MGINFNNFLNSNLNQNIANLLSESKQLKESWREEKQNRSIANVVQRPVVKRWLEDNPEAVTKLFRDNREILSKLFGRHHFTVNSGAGFFYVWRFNYDGSNVYLYADAANMVLEYGIDATDSEVIAFIDKMADYLK